MKKTIKQLVSGVIIKNHRVLLGLRKNTKDFSGYWSVSVGHVEKGEAEQQALAREMQEEIGIQIVSCKKLVTKKDTKFGIVNTFYLIEKWRGEVDNKEPHLCDELQWFSIENLPSPLTPVCKLLFNELDWYKVNIKGTKNE